MKGFNSFALLEFIKEFAAAQTDFLEAFLSSADSSSLFLKRLNQLHWERERGKVAKLLPQEQRKAELRKYRILFYRLKRDGLIAETNKRVKLTRKGKDKLKQLEELSSLPNPNYHSGTTKKSLIIIFDVPESLRTKRAWLRSALRNLKFRMVQQSVWKGKSKIPKKLLTDLQALDLAQYVEIFEVVKYGSLE